MFIQLMGSISDNLIFDSQQGLALGDPRDKPVAAQDIRITGNTIWDTGGLVRTLHSVYIGESLNQTFDLSRAQLLDKPTFEPFYVKKL